MCCLNKVWYFTWNTVENRLFDDVTARDCRVFEALSPFFQKPLACDHLQLPKYAKRFKGRLVLIS